MGVKLKKKNPVKKKTCMSVTVVPCVGPTFQNLNQEYYPDEIKILDTPIKTLTQDFLIEHSVFLLCHHLSLTEISQDRQEGQVFTCTPSQDLSR